MSPIQAPDLLPVRFVDWFSGRGWQARDHQLEMIAAAFHKIMAPWDEVEVFGDLVTFTIEQSPIDGGVYLLLENTNHRIDYIEGYNYYGYNYVLRSPLASDEPMHFENVDRIVDFFIKENKDTIKYFAHQLTLAA